jgi:hypothetical protein
MFLPDGRHVLVCLQNDSLVVWNFPMFTDRRVLPLPSYPNEREGPPTRLHLTTYAVAMNGNTLVAAGR